MENPTKLLQDLFAAMLTELTWNQVAPVSTESLLDEVGSLPWSWKTSSKLFKVKHFAKKKKKGGD